MCCVVEQLWLGQEWISSKQKATCVDPICYGEVDTSTDDEIRDTQKIQIWVSLSVEVLSKR
jgi:hypothetical protein